MSYSICLNCRSMVPRYDKYCRDCQTKFGFPDLPNFQREWDRGDFEEAAKAEVLKDKKDSSSDVKRGVYQTCDLCYTGKCSLGMQCRCVKLHGMTVSRLYTQ